MNILFTICGRAGSKGIRNKNIKAFLGIPLPLYTLAAIDLFLEQEKDINGDIVLNTDSPELVDILCRNSKCKVACIERKSGLAGDKVSKIAVIQDTLNEMCKKGLKQYNMVVDLDITAPLRTVADISNLIHKHEETGCDVTFSVTDSRRNPYFNMVKKGENGYRRVIDSNFVTRQDSPEMYDMNASLYAYKPDFLNMGKEIFQGHCEIVKMHDTAVLDLDHENDFELMEIIADYLYKEYNDFNEIRSRSKYLFESRDREGT